MWVRPALVLIAGATAVAVSLYAAFPWVAAALAPRVAALAGLDGLQVVVGRPGLRELVVNEVVVASGRLRITATGGRVRYEPGELAAGQLAAVHFEAVEVWVESDDAGPSPGAPAPAIDVGGLFAAVPADRLTVQRLVLEVPALEFRAAGSLELTPPSLHTPPPRDPDTTPPLSDVAPRAPDSAPRANVIAPRAIIIAPRALALDLHGLEPAQARRFELHARLTADGGVDVRLAERGSDGDPFLALSSVLGGPRLDLRGQVDVHGFVLDLISELGGLPPAEGRMQGALEATVAWPLTDSWWSSATARGRFGGDWRTDDGAVAVADAAADWELQEGRLAGEAAGAVAVAAHRLRVRASLASWRLAEATGEGTLAIDTVAGSEAADPEAAEPGAGHGGNGHRRAPVLEASWRLEPDQLSVTGRFRIDQPELELIAAGTGLPPGRGAFAGEVSTRLPWPLPDPWRELRPPGRGQFTGHWEAAAGDLGLRGLEAEWRLEQSRLSGTVAGDVGYRGLALPLRLALDDLALQETLLTFTGEAGLGDAVRLPFTGEHRLDGGTGLLQLSGGASVQQPLARALVSGWDEPFDVTAGTIAVDAGLGWEDGGLRTGRARLDLDGVGAHYQGYTVRGVTGSLGFAAGPDGAWSLAPSPLRIGALDTGVEIRNVATAAAWSADTVSLQTTTAELLGGIARVAPFAYRLAVGEADFVVDLEDVDLSRVLALEGEHVSGTGTLNGTLPVQVRNHAPAVVAGTVHAEPPGGVLHVSRKLAGGMGQPGLDFALRALQDFRYDVLSADVAYTGSGDLTLAVHLEGSNPDIEAGRPIHYNVTVNENVPTLLKSLRLQDEVSRGIERRVTD